jgi:hypothetical protein
MDRASCESQAACKTTKLGSAPRDDQRNRAFDFIILACVLGNPVTISRHALLQTFNRFYLSNGIGDRQRQTQGSSVITVPRQ